MRRTWLIASLACSVLALSVGSIPAARASGRSQGASTPRPENYGSRAARRAPLSQASGDGVVAARGCEACESWSACLDGLGGVGASTQLVPLKNGIMYVYTADTPAGVHAVQSVVARHRERLRALTSASRLCPACRALRSASARGRLSSEVLNIDGGCIMVTTSSDRAVVMKIYAEAGIPGSHRVKG